VKEVQLPSLDSQIFLILLSYYFLKGVIRGFEFPVGVSFDVTNRCNLRCKHFNMVVTNSALELPKWRNFVIAKKLFS
jgi:hypothetical protein